MREHEMRQRIERAIRRTAVPATMGITLGLVACGGRVMEDAADGADAAPVAQTTGAGGGPVAVQPKPLPHSGSTGTGGVMYMAQMPYPESTGTGGAVYMAQMPDQGGTGGMYMAQMPDAWAPTAIDAGTTDVEPDRTVGETAAPVALYMAQMPDAASD